MNAAAKGERPTGRPPGILIRQVTNHDPRLSRPQVKAVEELVTWDTEARILGLDANFRPVVTAYLGHPPEERRYAILRNGDPAAPVLMNDDRLREEWW